MALREEALELTELQRRKERAATYRCSKIGRPRLRRGRPASAGLQGVGPAGPVAGALFAARAARRGEHPK